MVGGRTSRKAEVPELWRLVERLPLLVSEKRKRIAAPSPLPLSVTSEVQRR